MATLTALVGNLAFKMDTGEVKDGKTVYRTSSLSQITAHATAAQLGAIATAIQTVLPLPVDEMTLRRNQRLTI